MAIRVLNKKEYQLGQQVALKYCGNASRGKQENDYKLATITKIGNSILYVNETIKIDMKTGMDKSNYTPNYILYDSEKHLLDTLETELIIDNVRKYLGQYGYPSIELDKMKEVAGILGL